MVTSSQMFEWNAEEYAKNSLAQKIFADEFITKLTFIKSDVVLDLGCGDGIISSGLAQRVNEGYVVGADLSFDMVRYASSHFPVTEHPNLSFVQVDSLSLPFKAVFDVVFSNSCFHWISDHQTLLTGIAGVLRPKGRLFINMIGKGSLKEIDASERVMSNNRWNRYFTGFTFPFTFYNSNEYLPLLEGAGFTVKRLDFIPKERVYKDRKHLTNSIRNVWHPFLERVPADLRDRFLSEVVDILLDEIPLDNNGCIHLPMYRLEVEAVTG